MVLGSKFIRFFNRHLAAGTPHPFPDIRRPPAALSADLSAASAFGRWKVSDFRVTPPEDRDGAVVSAEATEDAAAVARDAEAGEDVDDEDEPENRSPSLPSAEAAVARSSPAEAASDSASSGLDLASRSPAAASSVDEDSFGEPSLSGRVVESG
jgi:hypothetical protein